MYRRLICVFIISFSCSISYALSFIEKYVPSYAQVGSGRMSFLFWSVYDATLYAPYGRWSSRKPYALSLKYQMDLKGKDIAKRSIEEMQSQGYNNSRTLHRWYRSMRNIFPDVTSGTVLTGVLKADGATIFYKGNKRIGKITDPKFGKLFFGIWLSPKTSAPSLRQKLLNIK